MLWNQDNKNKSADIETIHKEEDVVAGNTYYPALGK